MSLLTRFWKDDSGQGLVEYALILALVAVALILILIYLRNRVGDVFARAGNELKNAPGNQYPAPST